MSCRPFRVSFTSKFDTYAHPTHPIVVGSPCSTSFHDIPSSPLLTAWARLSLPPHVTSSHSSSRSRSCFSVEQLFARPLRMLRLLLYGLATILYCRCRDMMVCMPFRHILHPLHPDFATPSPCTHPTTCVLLPAVFPAVLHITPRYSVPSTHDAAPPFFAFI